MSLGDIILRNASIKWLHMVRFYLKFTHNDQMGDKEMDSWCNLTERQKERQSERVYLCKDTGSHHHTEIHTAHAMQRNSSWKHFSTSEHSLVKAHRTEQKEPSRLAA